MEISHLTERGGIYQHDPACLLPKSFVLRALFDGDWIGWLYKSQKKGHIGGSNIIQEFYNSQHRAQPHLNVSRKLMSQWPFVVDAFPFQEWRRPTSIVWSSSWPPQWRVEIWQPEMFERFNPCQRYFQFVYMIYHDITCVMQRHLKLKKGMISLTGNNSLPVSLSHSHWCWRIGIAREMQKAWRVGNATDEISFANVSCDSARMRPGKRNVKPTKRTKQNTGPGEDLTKLFHVWFFPQEHDVAKIERCSPLN